MKAGLPDPARGEFNDAIRRVRSRGPQAARVVSLPATHRVIPAHGFLTRSDVPAGPSFEYAADCRPAFRHSAHCDHREGFDRFDSRIREVQTGGECQANTGHIFQVVTCLSGHFQSS
jgi:hypothetical protein